MYLCAEIFCETENYIVRLFPASWKGYEAKNAKKNINPIWHKRKDDDQDEPEVAGLVASMKRRQKKILTPILSINMKTI